jgi:hypothetical protein
MDGEKCGHEQCTCYVDFGETYCSDRCREAEQQDPDAPPHGRCGCRHLECLSRD